MNCYAKDLHAFDKFIMAGKGWCRVLYAKRIPRTSFTNVTYQILATSEVVESMEISGRVYEIVREGV